MAIINYTQFAKNEGLPKQVKDFSSSVIVDKDKKTNKGTFVTVAGCDEGTTKTGKRMLFSFLDTKKLIEAYRKDEYFKKNCGLNDRQIDILANLDE